MDDNHDVGSNSFNQTIEDELDIDKIQPSLTKCLTDTNGETTKDYEKGNDDGVPCDNIDWTTEDELELELELENFKPSPKCLTVPNGDNIKDFGEGSSSYANLSNSKVFDHLVGMGFSGGMVAKVIQEYGEDNEDKLVEELLKNSGEAGVEWDNIDWTTEDELEIESYEPSSKCLTVLKEAPIRNYGEGSSYANISHSKVFDHFVGMGFLGGMVAKVIQEYGEDNEDKLLEELLTYSVLKSSPQKRKQVEPGPISSEYPRSTLDDFSNDGEIKITDSKNDGNLPSLVKMGFEEEEALAAIERLGPNSSLEDLVDFIGDAQFAKAEDALLPPENKAQYNKHDILRKRRFHDFEVLGIKRQKICQKKKFLEEEEETLNLPNPMIGFEVPIDSYFISERKPPLPAKANGPPYFYFENVGSAPEAVWQIISKVFYGVEPEFFDSKYFCAIARKRGYIHNLPIVNRFPLLPFQSLTIQEALPLTRKWWPSWDQRTKLNCLQKVTARAKVCERIGKALACYNGDRDPPKIVKKYVLEECTRWNLVWVGKNKVASLEPDEVETLLGFPEYHTRGISWTNRFKSLRNSFQVDTVAYHLSVLKDKYPDGINVLSLFSGIGGAEVALYRLGIPLKNVVSIEKSKVNKNIIKSWWEQNEQKGNLVQLDDVREISEDRLEKLMSTFGAFDLIVGGGPCSNLAGRNKVSRYGLDGTESSSISNYFRILELVKEMSPKYQ